MRRLIKKIVPCFQSLTASLHGYQKPRFECHEHARTLDLEVYMPGVTSDAIEMTVDHDVLVVTARKSLPVRQNFQAANFEAVQPHYQLRIQLTDRVDPKSIWGELRDGVLSIHLKKKAAAALRLSVA